MRPFPFMATVLSVAFLPTLAQAAQHEPFEIVKGWEIERTVGDTGANPCIMSHTYEDKDDNNATNVVVFALDGSKVTLVLVYQGWDFDKEETVKVPLFLDKKPIKIKTTWTGDGKSLRAQFPDTLVPDLLSAKTVILRFENGNADFRIPNFAAGYEALRRCDAAPPKSAPQAATGAAIASPAPAPAPAVPSQARIASYAVGIALQRVLKECDVASTGRQRAAVEARMAALQPELAPYEANIRAQLAQKDGFSCPPAGKEADFQALMTKFIDLSPEAFAAAMEQQGVLEKSAEAAPKP